MSGKSVAAKLLIRPGAAVWVSGRDRAPLLGSPPDVWSGLRFRPLRPGEPPFTGGR